MKDLGDKAPIIEAILYLEFHFDEEVMANKLEATADILATSFPKKIKIHTYESSISFEEGQQDTKSVHFEGFKLDSEDGKRVVQIRPNGLAYSRLKPYADGDKLLNEYQDLWQKYTDYLSPKGILKIGLRNINKFYVPANEYSSYFKISPNVAIAGNTPLLVGMSTQNCIVSSPAHDNAQGNISTFLTVKNGSQIDVIFDIDVYQSFDNYQNTFDTVAKVYANLRKLKNALFFGNITEKAEKELFHAK